MDKARRLYMAKSPESDVQRHLNIFLIASEHVLNGYRLWANILYQCIGTSREYDRASGIYYRRPEKPINRKRIGFIEMVNRSSIQ
jgi:hypothetical protein